MIVLLLSLCLSLLLYFSITFSESFSNTFINSINSNTLPDFRKLLKTVDEEGDTKCNIKDVFTFNGKRKGGIRLLIVGSVHGNEPAGTVACYKLIEKLSKRNTLKSGTVTVIPTVNPCGLLQYTRTSNGTDLNRTYEEGDTVPQQNRTVMKYVKKSDVVIDCHEGHGYYLLNGTLKQLNNSMGSTITAGKGLMGSPIGKHISSVKLAENAVNYVNSTLNLSGYYKFSLYPDNILKGTLREYCNSRNTPYILIETSGQNEIQPINVRREQQLLVFESVMRDIEIL